MLNVYYIINNNHIVYEKPRLRWEINQKTRHILRDSLLVRAVSSLGLGLGSNLTCWIGWFWIKIEHRKNDVFMKFITHVFTVPLSDVCSFSSIFKWMVSPGPLTLHSRETGLGNETILTNSTAQGSGGNFKDRKPIGEVGCCDAWMSERTH